MLDLSKDLSYYKEIIPKEQLKDALNLFNINLKKCLQTKIH